MRSRCFAAEDKMGFGSDNGSSARLGLRRGFLCGEDANGEVRGEPDGAEEQDDAEEQFRAHRGSAMKGSIERRHIFRGLNENKHCAKSHGHNQDGGQDGSDDHFHGTWIGPPQRGTIRKDSARKATTSVVSSKL